MVYVFITYVEITQNNNCESNVLVLKDTILQRVKEYNVNGLIDRLIIDFNDHFKNKLLSNVRGNVLAPKKAG